MHQFPTIYRPDYFHSRHACWPPPRISCSDRVKAQPPIVAVASDTFLPTLPAASSSVDQVVHSQSCVERLIVSGDKEGHDGADYLGFGCWVVDVQLFSTPSPRSFETCPLWPIPTFSLSFARRLNFQIVRTLFYISVCFRILPAGHPLSIGRRDSVAQQSTPGPLPAGESLLIGGTNPYLLQVFSG
jgi:hypothetical protein